MANFRNWVHRHSAAVTLVAVAVMIFSLGTIIIQQAGGSRISNQQVYFFDLGTGDLYEVAGGTLSPDLAPSGQLGVRAHVFACGDCADESKRFVGWLYRYSEDAKRLLEMPPMNDRGEAMPLSEEELMTIQEGELVMPVGGEQWSPMMSQTGANVIDSVHKKCENHSAVECLPKK